jgi:hypothetical protein
MDAKSFYGPPPVARSSEWEKLSAALRNLKVSGEKSFTTWRVFAKQDQAFFFQKQSPLPLRILSFEVLNCIESKSSLIPN